MVKNILIFVLIAFLVIFIYQIFFNRPTLSTAKINLGKQEYQLEIAKTVPQQSKGLMDRTSLCSNCGMIFVFGLEMPQAFWMKNTLIPLDMIFLDHSGLIINIVTAVPEPGVADSKLTIYQSSSPAKYVIELNSGDANKLGLKPGDIVKIPSL
jgi:uncharacterized membrane protein (UPF0127 family)